MNIQKKIVNPKIAVIPGDGIGKEVMPEGVRALESAARKFGIQFQFDHFDFASCDYYQKHGKMMPDNWFDTLMKYDAIFFGAVGMPNILPDHLSLWGSLIQFRRGFDQYVNLRPVRLLPIVVQESVFSRHGVDRILKFAYELAQSRPKKHLTSATKSNGIAITMPYWDERVEVMAKNYADVRTDKYHIDILTAQFVMNPDRFDVVVASNLFGDILSDLGPACTGTIAVAPSASINPEGKFPSLFEPVHGSAPDIYGKKIANPIGQIWSAALMLDHLGYPEAGQAVFNAIEKVLSAGPGHAPLTPDIGGKASTEDLGKAIAAAI